MKNEKDKFSWKDRARSFGYAWDGIVHFFKTGHNAQLHLAATVFVIAMAVYFKTTKIESIALIFCIAFVWVTEIVNTAIERTMDFINPETDIRIKHIKDLAAAAVLVSSLVSVAVGIIIFIPKFL